MVYVMPVGRNVEKRRTWGDGGRGGMEGKRERRNVVRDLWFGRRVLSRIKKSTCFRPPPDLSCLIKVGTMDRRPEAKKGLIGHAAQSS